MTFSNSWTPTSPAGFKIRPLTAYELKFVGLSTTGGGYGYVGAASNVEIVNDSSGAVVAPSTPLTAGPDAGTRNATFLVTSSAFSGPGLYRLRQVGSGTTVGYFVAYPTDDITVSVSPNPATFTGGSIALSVSTGVPGAIVSSTASGLISGAPATDGSGNLAFVSTLPMGAGTWRVHAAKDLNPGSPQFIPGTASTSMPERMGNTTLTVQAAALSLTVVDASATTGSGSAIVHRPSYPSGGPPVFRYSGGSFPSDATPTRINLSMTSPHQLLAMFNQSMLAGGSGNVTLSPSSCLNLTTGGFGCGSAMPSVTISRDTGDIAIRSGDDVEGSDVWAPGTYTVALGLETAGGIATAPEYKAAWSFTSAAESPTARVSIANVTGGALVPVSNAIRVTNVTDFGALTLNLSFNASIVQIENVSAGNLTGGQVTWNLNNSTGLLQILVTTSSIPGPSGSFTLVNLTMRAVGPIGTTSPLGLSIAEAVRSDGSTLPMAITNGTFRAGLLGDVTGDSIVDALDVTRLSQFIVALVPPPPIELGNADVNGDGRVTGVDALFLRQYVEGTRPTL